MIAYCSALAESSVAIPESEIGAYLRTKELFQLVTSRTDPTYTGTISLCGGASASVQIRHLDVEPTTWLIRSDGRFGIDLSWKANAWIDLDSHQWLCGMHGPVECSGNM